ncbi:MAG: trypsin-like peptidase domain-containing protein [Anaerolineae bacterium]|jgi:S1-C subfamily serine protease
MMKRKAMMLLVLLLLPALVLTGCGLPSLDLAAAPSLDSTASDAAAAPAVAAQPAQAEPLTSGEVLDALEGTLGAIYEQVSPSVVNIRVTAAGDSVAVPQIPGFEMPDELPQQEGLGSGFVWDEAGHIVTNNHVVEDATRITVVFADDTTVPAEVVGTDPDSDLAVIKVDVPAERLQPVALADSTQVSVGELAVAIGNPFGLDGTMTVGFISALGRSLPVAARALTASYTIPDIIQTDAPINPGNSGGVLVDDQGRVIGVPTAIESPVRANAGIGFAVPSAIVQKVVPVLIEDGAYEHPWIGISGTTLTSVLAEAMDLGADQRGVLVAEVIDGSPADEAGLQGSDRMAEIDGQQVRVGGDVIVGIDGELVRAFEDLVVYLARSTRVDQTVTLSLLRDGETQTVELTLAARPNTETVVEAQSGSEQREGGDAWLGIQGMTLMPEIAEAMDLDADQAGVLVAEIVEGSPADEAGLRGSAERVEIDGQTVLVGGDVIVAVDGEPVSDIPTLRALLQEAGAGQAVSISLLRGGDEIQVAVTLGERPASMP